MARQRQPDGNRARRRRVARARVHRVPAGAQATATAARRRACPPIGRRLRRGRARPTRPRARRNGPLEPTLARALRFGCSVRRRGRRRSGRARRPALVHAVAAARQRRLLDARDGAGKRRRAARHRVCRGSHGRRDARALERHRRRDRGGPEPIGPLQRAPRRGSCDERERDRVARDAWRGSARALRRTVRSRTLPP